jgi:hypothetical protein
MTTTINNIPFASRVAPHGRQAPSSSCFSSARLALSLCRQQEASTPGEQGSVPDPDRGTGAIHTGDEFSRVLVHSDDLPAAGSSVASEAVGNSASDDDALNSIRHHFTSTERIVQVKQCDPSAILRLARRGIRKGSTPPVLQRHAKSEWMQQKLYVPKTLAAAHEAMHPALTIPPTVAG